jgi:hypothetical protein
MVAVQGPFAAPRAEDGIDAGQAVKEVLPRLPLDAGWLRRWLGFKQCAGGS